MIRLCWGYDALDHVAQWSRRYIMMLLEVIWMSTTEVMIGYDVATLTMVDGQRWWFDLRVTYPCVSRGTCGCDIAQICLIYLFLSDLEVFWRCFGGIWVLWESDGTVLVGGHVDVILLKYVLFTCFWVIWRCFGGVLEVFWRYLSTLRVRWYCVSRGTCGC